MMILVIGKNLLAVFARVLLTHCVTTLKLSFFKTFLISELKVVNYGATLLFYDALSKLG